MHPDSQPAHSNVNRDAVNHLNAAELKEDINNFLWQRLPDQTTLREAEDIAVDVFTRIVKAWE